MFYLSASSIWCSVMTANTAIEVLILLFIPLNHFILSAFPTPMTAIAVVFPFTEPTFWLHWNIRIS